MNAPTKAQKRDAQAKLTKAIIEGGLVRPATCSKCGVKCVAHGHHTDYFKPLTVVWLCPKCHRGEHKKHKDSKPFMKTGNRYMHKDLEKSLPELNAKLAKLGHQYQFVAGARNGYSAIDLATKAQAKAYCCQRMLIGGSPRECLAECHQYIAALV